MNSLNQATLTPPVRSNANSDSKSKYITFKLAGYLFALPSEHILRVIATPPPSQGGMVSMGLVQLGQYSIRILDLSKMLDLEDAETFAGIEKDLEFHTGEKVTGAAQNPPFLIVSQKADQTLWGIAVHEPPDLIELADQTLSPVPPEQRAFGTLQGISCVGMFNLEGNRHTLLILDMPTLLAQQIETSSQSMFVGIGSPLEIESPLVIEPPFEIEPPLEIAHDNEDNEDIDDLLSLTL